MWKHNHVWICYCPHDGRKKSLKENDGVTVLNDREKTWNQGIWIRMLCLEWNRLIRALYSMMRTRERCFNVKLIMKIVFEHKHYNLARYCWCQNLQLDEGGQIWKKTTIHLVAECAHMKFYHHECGIIDWCLFYLTFWIRSVFFWLLNVCPQSKTRPKGWLWECFFL